MMNMRKQIRDYCLSTAIEPGSYVTERKIADHFQLKRGNAREMLLALEGEGTIQCTPQKGYAPVDYRTTDHYTALSLRYTIEKEALRESVTNATREDMVRITLIFEDMEQALKNCDIDSYAQADEEFHTALIAASHDNLLIHFFDFMKAVIFPRFLPTPLGQKQIEEAQVQHRKIYEAFKSRNPQSLQDTLKEHIGQKLKD